MIESLAQYLFYHNKTTTMQNAQNYLDLNSKNIAVRKEAKDAMFDILIFTDVTIIKETAKAILISGLTNAINKNNSFMSGWIPKSIIDINSDGDMITFTLPGWFNNSFEPII